MKVEIKEVAVFTKDNGEEVIVWDRALIDTIRSLSTTLPPVPVKGRRSNRAHKPKPESQITVSPEKAAAPDQPPHKRRGRSSGGSRPSAPRRPAWPRCGGPQPRREYPSD